jgi:hypothetical protein
MRRAVVAMCRRIVSIGIRVAAIITSSPTNLLDDSNLINSGYP